MLHLRDIKVDTIWANQSPVCTNLGHFPVLLFPGRGDADLSMELPLSCCSIGSMPATGPTGLGYSSVAPVTKWQHATCTKIYTGVHTKINQHMDTYKTEHTEYCKVGKRCVCAMQCCISIKISCICCFSTFKIAPDTLFSEFVSDRRV